PMRRLTRAGLRLTKRGTGSPLAPTVVPADSAACAPWLCEAPSGARMRKNARQPSVAIKKRCESTLYKLRPLAVLSRQNGSGFSSWWELRGDGAVLFFRSCIHLCVTDRAAIQLFDF